MNLKDKIIYTYQKYHYNIQNEYLQKLCNKYLLYFKNKSFSFLEKENWKYIKNKLKNLLELDYNFYYYHNNENYKNILNEQINIPNIKNYITTSYNSNYIIFINGIYIPILSNIKYNNNIIILSLSDALKNKKYINIIKNYYGKISYKYKNSLIAINNLLSIDGTFIYINKNILLNNPIYIYYFSTKENNNKYLMLNPRNLIIIEDNSQVNIIEKYFSITNSYTLTNVLTEIYTGNNSILKYYKIQNYQSYSSILDNTFLTQKENSNIYINTFSLGGKLIRNNLNIFQYKKNSKIYIGGLTIIEKKQIVDNHTYMHHLSPYCESYELYKGIYFDNSLGIFNGKIKVYNNAYKINAFQKNNNILLSNNASVNAKPQLEIFNNDVKCTHGCTVGYFNEKILFYLRSRGISKKQAKLLILLSFINETIDNNIINIYNIKNIIHNKLKINIYNS